MTNIECPTLSVVGLLEWKRQRYQSANLVVALPRGLEPLFSPRESDRVLKITPPRNPYGWSPAF